MKILVVGSGGREHALVWKIAQSPKVERLYVTAGNAGISELADCINIKVEDTEGLLKFAKDNKIDLTVVGPEAPLVAGIVNKFQKEGLKVFGPNRQASQLEASKVFAKEFMRLYRIPTAEFKVFDDSIQAKDYIRKTSAPLVVKADGLAQGKGVIVCPTPQEAIEAIELIMERKVFGRAGDKIVIEDCLKGEEVSIMVITDGKDLLPLESSQDHKRVYDDDRGANTGGMGAYSPAPVVSKELFKEILNNIVYRTIDGLTKERIDYRGVLYVGIMITKDGPKVLEFNVRFGDPETQAIMPRLKSDLVEVMLATCEGELNKIVKNGGLSWDKRACICVVCASGGYPGEYEKGKEIFGLDEVKKRKDVIIFHAGTKRDNGRIVTSGGRVLGVCALGEGIKKAVDRAYEAVEKIYFDKMHYRNDIAHNALKVHKTSIA